MKRIKLNSKKYPNKYALVDDEDFEYLNQFKWHPVKRNHTFYVARSAKINNKDTQIMMHREILKLTDSSIYTDHRDRNGLNNQKNNLRKCIPKQNNMNRCADKKSTSQYKGVSWSKEKQKWQSHICNESKRKHIGYFDNEKDAALSYDYYANKLFNKFAYLNFPNALLTKKEYEKLTKKNYSSKYKGVCWHKSNKNGIPILQLMAIVNH